MNFQLLFLAISWVVSSPTAETVKTTYETIVKTMEASVSSFKCHVMSCQHLNILGFEPLHNIETDRIGLCFE